MSRSIELKKKEMWVYMHIVITINLSSFESTIWPQRPIGWYEWIQFL